jgi:hypothetical protein
MPPRASHSHAKTCGAASASVCSCSSERLGRCASSRSLEPCIKITQQTTCLKRSAVAGCSEQTTSGCTPCCTTRTVTMINHGLHPSSNRATKRQKIGDTWENTHPCQRRGCHPDISTMWLNHGQKGQLLGCQPHRDRALEPSRQHYGHWKTSARAELEGCH